MLLEDYAAKMQEEDLAMLNSDLPPPPADDDSTFLDDYIEDLPRLINFTYFELLDLWRDFDFVWLTKKTRGPQPKVSSLDSLFIALLHYSLYLPIEEHAKYLHLRESTVNDTIRRVRPLLLKTLKARWDPAKFRPTPLNSRLFPHIGLLVDSITLQIYHPHLRVDKAKVYFDARNEVYGLKKEVGVMASSPHYALFSQKGVPGATRDYQILQGTNQSYQQFTTKTDEEARALDPDQDRQWAILGDIDYQGPPEDTPFIRRLFAQPSLSPVERNEELSKIRAPVECFFGRTKSLWQIARSTYRGDHSNFDADADICFLLTNEHIKNGAPLLPEDSTFYAQTIAAAIASHRAQVEKAKNSMIKCRERKRARLEEMFSSAS